VELSPGWGAFPGVRGAVWAVGEGATPGEWIHGTEAVWEVRSVGEEVAAHVLGRRPMAPHYPGLKVRRRRSVRFGWELSSRRRFATPARYL
jgi:hypothetical protein